MVKPADVAVEEPVDVCCATNAPAFTILGAVVQLSTIDACPGLAPPSTVPLAFFIAKAVLHLFLIPQTAYTS